MSTVLDNSPQPIWVWIIVIVIGSLFILGIIAWLIRRWIIRRNERLDCEMFSDEPAEKKLTLRRGRIVPATSYLSLTGSRFGVNSYTGEDGQQTPSVRSKSPFEWWNNIKGRSSRLSYVSHMSSSNFPSRSGSFYQRQEMSTSKLSLTSKNESIHATVMEVTVAKPQQTLVVPPFKRSTRSYEPVNFSRSFTPQTQRSLAANHHHTLSRIDEATPRQSIFSTTSLKHRTGSYSASDLGHTLGSNRASHASLLQMPPPIKIHSRNASANSTRSLGQQNLDQDHPYMHSTPDLSSSEYMPSMPTTPTFPTPVGGSTITPVSRQSLWGSSMKQFPCLEQHQQYDSEHTVSQPGFAITTENQSCVLAQTSPFDSDYDRGLQHEPPRDTQTEQPQEQRPQIPFGPLRAQSKKGNVLRKKSLERSQAWNNHV